MRTATPSHAIAKVERIRQLPIPEAFKPVLMDVARYVIIHADQFNTAAKAINGELQKSRRTMKALGQTWDTASGLFWMFRDVVNAGPSANNGRKYADWAKRLMLLSALAVYSGDLSRYGTCGRVQWGKRWKRVELSGHGTIPWGFEGRETVLFEDSSDGNTLVLRKHLDDHIHESEQFRPIRMGNGRVVESEIVHHRKPIRGTLGTLVDMLKPILDELRLRDPNAFLVNPSPSNAGRKSVKAKPKRRRRNEKRTGLRTRPPKTAEIANLKPPALDMCNGSWVRNKMAARMDGVEVATLATYRKTGMASEDKMHGKDQYGRIWQRRGTPTSHPWYLKSTLQNPG